MPQNDEILHLIGLAHKAGKLEIGEEPVGAACRSRHAKLILFADNTAPNTVRRIAHFGEAGNVLSLVLPCTKDELGSVLGRTSCAMVALMDSGFAASITKKLAVMDPERYANASEMLSKKADKVLQRQKEKRQHEKNLKEGHRKNVNVSSTPDKTPSKESSRQTAQKPKLVGGKTYKIRIKKDSK